MSQHRLVWEALTARGCDPRGPGHQATAKCPAHDDRSPSLRVGIGTDGRVLLHCHAGCTVEQIVAALGLEMRDLFPPGHHHARRRHFQEARRADLTGNARTVVDVLKALQDVGARWYIELRTDCQHCGSPGALIWASDRGVFLSCPGDEDALTLGYGACTLRQFQEAIADRTPRPEPTHSPIAGRPLAVATPRPIGGAS